MLTCNSDRDAVIALCRAKLKMLTFTNAGLATGNILHF